MRVLGHRLPGDRATRRVALVALGALLAACGGGGGGGFPYPLWVPTDVAVADVDGDGLADVLTLAQFAASSSAREGRLVVHRQDATGAFTAVQTVVVGVYPWRMAVGDLDGDGAVDVAVVDGEASPGTRVLRQDPGNRGRFLPAESYATGFGYGIAVGDLNGDGAPDLAVADSAAGSGRLVVLYQDPDLRGSFGPPVAVPVPGTSTGDVATGDLDGDGRTDLAIGVYLPRTGTTPNVATALSLQQVDGTPGPVVLLGARTGVNIARLRVADYDGDGRNDLFSYFTAASAAYEPTLAVELQATVPGTFSGPVDTPLASLPGEDDAVFADLDGDGRPDAATVGFFPVGSPSVVRSRLNRFTQSGLGGFSVVASTDLAIDASRLTAGNVDGDGANEIVVLGPRDEFRVLD